MKWAKERAAASPSRSRRVATCGAREARRPTRPAHIMRPMWATTLCS